MSYSCADTIARTVWREDIVGPSHAVDGFSFSRRAYHIIIYQ